MDWVQILFSLVAIAVGSWQNSGKWKYSYLLLCCFSSLSLSVRPLLFCCLWTYRGCTCRLRRVMASVIMLLTHVHMYNTCLCHSPRRPTFSRTAVPKTDPLTTPPYLMSPVKNTIWLCVFLMMQMTGDFSTLLTTIEARTITMWKIGL